jgi:hypothetical protein
MLPNTEKMQLQLIEEVLMKQLAQSRILLFGFMLLLMQRLVIGVVRMCPAAPY